MTTVDTQVALCVAEHSVVCPDRECRRTPSRARSVTRSPAVFSLLTLFQSYWGRILTTYALFTLENVLRLVQPYVLGLAINGLLSSSCVGIAAFVLQHLAHLVVSSGRQMYDTRAFSSIYTDTVTRLVLQQRSNAVGVSRVTARSALSREIVNFFERDVPVLLAAFYSVTGALVALAWYDSTLVFLCLVSAAPALVLNWIYGTKTLGLNTRLHDQLEHEVDVIGRGQHTEVRGHYASLAHWRIKLSDLEAANFGVMELFILCLIAVSLVRSCTASGGDAGSIIATFRYVVMFVSGLDAIPLLVRQASRLRDIARRTCAINSPETQPHA